MGAKDSKPSFISYEDAVKKGRIVVVNFVFALQKRATII